MLVPVVWVSAGAQVGLEQTEPSLPAGVSTATSAVWPLRFTHGEGFTFISNKMKALVLASFSCPPFLDVLFVYTVTHLILV